MFPKWAWSGSREQFLHCGLRKFRHSKSSVYRWYAQLDRRRFVYDTYIRQESDSNASRLSALHMFITHRPTLTLQLHNFDLFRTCHTSFCTVAWQLARFQLTRRIARSLGDSWSSCVYGLAVWSISLAMTGGCPLSWRGQGHVSNFYILDLENFATASRRCTGVMNVDGQLVDNTYDGRARRGWMHKFIIPLPKCEISYSSWPRDVLALWWLTIRQVGVVRVTWPISTFWGPGHTFGADEARHFKFGLQTERRVLPLHMLMFCSIGVHVHQGHVTS